MGVGKSTIGKSLAQRMNLAFRDTDVIFEERNNSSISDYFVEIGEESFRQKELEIVLECLDSFDGVLALGGGAPVRAESMLEAADSTIIFLDISLSAVAERVGFTQARPLLAINPRTKWQELMNERKPLYERLADATILVDNKSVEEIADEILEVLSS